MLLYLLNTVAPVFLILGAGYLSVKRGVFDRNMIDTLMKFAIQIAVPCLLFRATSTIDLQSAYNWRLLLAFYAGSTCSFVVACFIAWRFFNRRPGEAVAVGFSALFSNLVLLGLPIVERALGQEALATAYALVSLHAPFCYLLGISAMEMLRADGRSFSDTAQVVVTTMFRNSLMISIGLGFVVNITGLHLPEFVGATLDMLTRAALPTALFALGGILTRYALSSQLAESGVISILSLFLHPSLTFLICWALGVDDMNRNTVVLMASMAPGINAYLFASLYSRGEGAAANTVLLSTGFAVITVSFWLLLLNP